MGRSIIIKCLVIFFFQAEDGIRDADVTGVQTCALPLFYRCKKCIHIDMYNLSNGNIHMSKLRTIFFKRFFKSIVLYIYKKKLLENFKEFLEILIRVNYLLFFDLLPFLP